MAKKSLGGIVVCAVEAMVGATSVQGVFENCPHSDVGVLHCSFAGALTGTGARIARGEAVELCIVCGCWRLPEHVEDGWNEPALWASLFPRKGGP